MKRIPIKIGDRFGRLVVTSELPYRIDRYVVYMCLCDCGEHTEAVSVRLRIGQKLSCGCLSHDNLIKRNTTHGDCKSSEYSAWSEMKKRCLNKNSKTFSYYGGRGITICDRWINSYENFLEDMGRKPSKSHSLDRIDPNGNYSKDNCRWATKTQQSRNTRTNKLAANGVPGLLVRRGKSKVAYEARIIAKHKHFVLGHFSDFFEACCARRSAENNYDLYDRIASIAVEKTYVSKKATEAYAKKIQEQGR